MPHTGDPRALQAALDGLSANLAILGVDGTILAVNAAWRAFGRLNGYDPPGGGVGTDYLAVCDAGDADGRQVAAAVRRAAAGDPGRFELVYPCHSADTERWFVARVTRSPDPERPLVVVAHEDITRRVLAERERGRLLGELMAVQEAERARLARELHDGLGQSLTSLRYGLHALTTCRPDEVPALAERLARYAADAQSEVRTLAQGLHPSVLDDLGLAAAVERLAENARERGGGRLVVDVIAPPADGHPPKAVAATVYRVMQEALHNVSRHAHAAHVEVLLEVAADHVRAAVEDDGRGFDPAAPGRGLGLTGMRERAALSGGTLAVRTRPGGGTAIDLTIPFTPEIRGE